VSLCGDGKFELIARQLRLHVLSANEITMEVELYFDVDASVDFEVTSTSFGGQFCKGYDLAPLLINKVFSVVGVAFRHTEGFICHSFLFKRNYRILHVDVLLYTRLGE
jgi:hypothetical protein